MGLDAWDRCGGLVALMVWGNVGPGEPIEPRQPQLVMPQVPEPPAQTAIRREPPVVAARPEPREPDYRAEILSYLMEPCMTASMAVNGAEATYEEIMAAIFALPDFEDMVASVTDTVRGRGRSERLNVYDYGVEQCIAGLFGAASLPPT